MNFRTPDLVSRIRAVNPRTGELMPHSVSRHMDFGVPVYRADGIKCSQGSTVFPKHVKAGDISKMERMVRTEYFKHKRGMENKITRIKNAGKSDRVTVRLNMFGVERVGSFIRGGSVCTVFPEGQF